MKEIKKTLTLDRTQYYEKHLAIINPMLPVRMTQKEIEVLASFMSLTGDIAKDRFGTTARKIIMEKHNISSSGIVNYLRSLREKQFINGDKIHPILFPEEDEQIYKFKLVNNDSNSS